MDLNDYSHEELHSALSTGSAQISILWAQMQTILASSEYFDSELSMQAAEAFKVFGEKLNQLLRDSLRGLGFTDEQIDYNVKMIRKALGFE